MTARDPQKDRVAWMAVCCSMCVTAYTGSLPAGFSVLFGLLCVAMMVIP